MVGCIGYIGWLHYSIISIGNINLFGRSVDGKVCRRLEAVVGARNAKHDRATFGQTEKDFNEARQDHLELSLLARLEQLDPEETRAEAVIAFHVGAIAKRIHLHLAFFVHFVP